MYQADNEKFGNFINSLRREKGMTQKEMAEKLFVSDKTVSKWERGASLPNMSLLIPLADLLEVSVTELLKGERLDEQQKFHADELEQLVTGSLEMTVREQVRTQRLKWGIAFILCILTAAVLLCVLYMMRISRDALDDCFLVCGLMFLFAGWLCFLAKETLPGYYDSSRIDFVSQGFFRLHLAGLAINNSNWSHICTVLKCFTLGTGVSYPLLCLISVLAGRDDLWDQSRDPLTAAVLIVMIVVVYIVGKKHE